MGISSANGDRSREHERLPPTCHAGMIGDCVRRPRATSADPGWLLGSNNRIRGARVAKCKTLHRHRVLAGRRVVSYARNGGIEPGNLDCARRLDRGTGRPVGPRTPRVAGSPGSLRRQRFRRTLSPSIMTSDRATRGLRELSRKRAPLRYPAEALMEQDDRRLFGTTMRREPAHA